VSGGSATVVVQALALGQLRLGDFLRVIFKEFKVDPAVVASPALTTVVDITGLLNNFSTARILLGL
jgi:magnesium transporter